MRCNDSARLVSGNLPMSSALIASTTPAESRLMSMAWLRLLRMPVTARIKLGGLRLALRRGPVAGAASCAKAGLMTGTTHGEHGPGPELRQRAAHEPDPGPCHGNCRCSKVPLTYDRMDVPPLPGHARAWPAFQTEQHGCSGTPRLTLAFQACQDKHAAKKAASRTLDPRPTGSATIALQRRVITEVRRCHHAAQQNRLRAKQLMTRPLLHPVTLTRRRKDARTCGSSRKERTVNALQRIVAAVGFAVLVSSGSSVFAANTVIVGGAEMYHQDHRRERRQFQGSHHAGCSGQSSRPGRHPQRRRALHCFAPTTRPSTSCRRHCRYTGEA